MHSVELPPAVHHLYVHHDKVPRLQVCILSATICGQRKVAAGEEMDGVGMVMDTGSLAPLRGPIHLALVAIVSLSVLLAQPLIELAMR